MTTTTTDSAVVEITGTLGLSVPNATDYIATPAFRTALTKTLAVITSQPESTINITSIGLTTRRLQGHQPRRLLDRITVAYSIRVPEAGASAVASAIGAASTSGITNTLKAELETAGLASIADTV